jgi:hypothetical protein
MNMPGGVVESDEDPENQEQSSPETQPKPVKAQPNLLHFEEDPIIQNRGSPNPPHPHEVHHAHFDPDIRRPVSKLPPLETKSQSFDMVPNVPAKAAVNPLRQPVNHQPQQVNAKVGGKNNGSEDLLEMHDFEDSDNYEEIGHSPAHLQQQYGGSHLPTHGQQVQQQV